MLFFSPFLLLRIFAAAKVTKVTNTILSQLRDSLDSATHILQQQPSMEGIEFLKAKKNKQRFILHMDNSPVHRSKIVQEFIKSHGMIMPPHLPYSPYLSPCDFYLFGLLKNQLIGKTFVSVDELFCWIEEKCLNFIK